MLDSDVVANERLRSLKDLCGQIKEKENWKQTVLATNLPRNSIYWQNNEFEATVTACPRVPLAESAAVHPVMMPAARCGLTGAATRSHAHRSRQSGTRPRGREPTFAHPPSVA
ncbi:hypothetical protein AAFF_G00379320 [Aldrovandia affinis]|uniref:Uncharacterized protein n=1 Tax=Aldrovandia affinis TaxID=143900 RepID=A0AAD7SFF9_9TELE|nr:hypothetical protein AAFF_G00379320 [Aldrovandia affinis]